MNKQAITNLINYLDNHYIELESYLTSSVDSHTVPLQVANDLLRTRRIELTELRVKKAQLE